VSESQSAYFLQFLVDGINRSMALTWAQSPSGSES